MKKQIEEIKVDDSGKQTITTSQYYRLNNADVEEVLLILPSGLQTHNITRTVINQDGTKMIEEER